MTQKASSSSLRRAQRSQRALAGMQAKEAPNRRCPRCDQLKPNTAEFWPPATSMPLWIPAPYPCRACIGETS